MSILFGIIATTPEETGEKIGAFIWPLLLCFAILKCVQISKRPKTCKKCLYGLMTVFFAWLITASIYLLVKQEVLSHGWLIAGFFCAMILGVSGIVLSIVGLVEMQGEKEKFETGFRYGIYTFIVGGIFLSLSAWGVYRGLKKAGFGSNNPIAERLASTPEKTASYPKENFTFRTPSMPWVKLSPARINPLAKVVFMRAPATYFMVIPMMLGVESGLGTDGFLEVTLANIKSLSGKVLEQKTLKIRNMAGPMIKVDMHINNMDITYLHWLVNHNGYYYQMVGWGIQRKRKNVYAFTKKMFARFNIKDRNLIKYSDNIAFAETNSKDQSPDDATNTIREFNFRFRKPPKKWIKLDANKLNPISQLAWLSSPNMYLMIIAENAGIEAAPEMDAFAKVIKDTLIANNGKILSEKPKKVGAYEGLMIETDAVQDGIKLSYTHWLYKRNGFFYQVIFWTGNGHRVDLNKKAEALLKHFEIIDPDLVSHSEGFEPLSDVTSKSYGYSIKLAGTSWLKWPNPEDDLPLADQGFVKKGNKGLIVYPCHLWTLDAHPDALLRGLLSCMDIPFPNKELRLTSTYQEKAATVREYTFDRKIETTHFYYMFRLINKGSMVYLISTWGEKGVISDAELLAQLNLVKLTNPPTTIPAPKDLTLIEKKRHAKVLNEAGLFHDSARQYAKAIPCFKYAFESVPTDVVTLVNYVDTLSGQGQTKKALTYLENLVSLRKKNQNLEALKAKYLGLTGAHSESVNTYQALFSNNYRNEAAFLNYLQIHQKISKPEKTLSVIKNYLTKNDSLKIRIRQASIMELNGQWKQAEEILHAELKKTPRNILIRYALISLFTSAQRHYDVIKECQKLIDEGLSSGDVYYYKGRAESGLKWYKKAKVSFEAGMKKAPFDKDIKSYLEFVSGRLGEGVNSNIKQPIPAVPLPTNLKPGVLSEASKSYVKGYSAYYSLRATAIAFEPGKRKRKTTYIRIKITSAKGLSRFSSFSFDFDPLYEEIYVNHIRILDAKQRVALKLKASDFYVLDDQDKSMATQDKTLHLPISGLKIGHEIDLAVTVRSLHPLKTFPYFDTTLSRSYPVLNGALFIQGSVDALGYEFRNVPKPQIQKDQLLWQTSNPPVYRYEPMIQDIHKFLPSIFISDKNATWDALAKDYLKSLKELMQPDQATTKIAQEKVKGLTTDVEKIKALTAYIQTEYSYKAIEFGRRALIPNAAAKTIQNKYGDCKDHALLLHHLLKGVGIASHLALVNTSGPVLTDLPSINQFNHMVLHVPSLGAQHMIDCTDKNCGINLPVPGGLGTKKALIIDPKGSKIIKLPPFPDRVQPFQIDRSCTIKGNDLLVQESISLESYNASHMRSYIKSAEASQRKKQFQSYLEKAIPALELKSITFEGIHKPQNILKMELSYLIRGAAIPAGDQIHLAIPTPWEQQFFKTPFAEQRKFPFRNNYATRFSTTTRFNCPGYTLSNLKALNTKTVRPPFAQWSIESSLDGTTGLIKFKGWAHSGAYEAKQYAAYKKAMDDMLSALKRKVVLRKK